MRGEGANGAAAGEGDERNLRPFLPRCPECRYDLSGLPDGPCPECGRPFVYERLRSLPPRSHVFQAIGFVLATWCMVPIYIFALGQTNHFRSTVFDWILGGVALLVEVALARVAHRRHPVGVWAAPVPVLHAVAGVTVIAVDRSVLITGGAAFVAMMVPCAIARPWRSLVKPHVVLWMASGASLVLAALIARDRDVWRMVYGQGLRPDQEFAIIYACCAFAVIAAIAGWVLRHRARARVRDSRPVRSRAGDAV